MQVSSGFVPSLLSELCMSSVLTCKHQDVVPLSGQRVTFSSAKSSVCIDGCENHVCHFYPGL